MTFQLIIFIIAILFGVLWFWKESKGNKIFRVVDKVFNSKELQMKATEKKGFVYEQSFVLRLLYVTIFFLIGLVIVNFIIRISIVSYLASMVAGTLIGTYLASFVFKSSKIIEEQTEHLEGIMNDTLEKGKDFIEDLKEDTKEDVAKNSAEKTKIEAPEKSGRQRLKDKGLL